MDDRKLFETKKVPASVPPFKPSVPPKNKKRLPNYMMPQHQWEMRNRKQREKDNASKKA